jgi:hypothetical protein
VRPIGDQYVMEDLGFIPPFADWARSIHSRAVDAGYPHLRAPPGPLTGPSRLASFLGPTNQYFWVFPRLDAECCLVLDEQFPNCLTTIIEPELTSDQFRYHNGPV